MRENKSPTFDIVSRESSPISVSASNSPLSMSTMKVSDFSSSSSTDSSLTIPIPSFSRQRSASISETGFRNHFWASNTRRSSAGSFSLASSRLSGFSYQGGGNDNVSFIVLSFVWHSVFQGLVEQSLARVFSARRTNRF